MKAFLISVLLLSAFLFSHVSADTVIDSFLGNNLNVSLNTFNQPNGSFVSSTQTATFLPFTTSERDVYVALTSKTANANTSLALEFVSPDPFSTALTLVTPSNAGGVFTLYYGERFNNMSLPTACIVNLSSEACLNSFTNTTSQRGRNADLTKSGTNIALNISASGVYQGVISLWWANTAGGNNKVYQDFLDFSFADMGSLDTYNGNIINLDQLYSTLNGLSFGGTYPDWAAVLAFAVQFTLQPNQIVNVQPPTLIGFSLSKNAILFDNNYDGLANPGETVRMQITIGIPTLTASFGELNLTWSDELSGLTILNQTAGFFATTTDQRSHEVYTEPTNGPEYIQISPDNKTVSYQLMLSYDNLDYAAIYNYNFLVVSFDTTINPSYASQGTPGPDGTYGFVNTVDLDFDLMSNDTDYANNGSLKGSLSASAPRIPVGGEVAAYLNFCSNNSLVAGELYTISFTITTNISLSQPGTTYIIASFNPDNSSLIEGYDPRWDCGHYDDDLICAYQQMSDLIMTEQTFNFTFLVSSRIDCALTHLSVTASSLTTLVGGGFFEAESNCSIPIIQNVDLSISASVGECSGVPLGGLINYTITYSNTGNSRAYNLHILDSFPNGTTPIIPATNSYNGSWVCDPITNFCTFTDPNPLERRQNRTIQIALQVSENYTGASVCTDLVLQSFAPIAYNVSNCNSLVAATNEPCVRVLPNPSPCPVCPTPSTPVITTTPSSSPCVYCLTGSTIKNLMKQATKTS